MKGKWNVVRYKLCEVHGKGEVLINSEAISILRVKDFLKEMVEKDLLVNKNMIQKC